MNMNLSYLKKTISTWLVSTSLTLGSAALAGETIEHAQGSTDFQSTPQKVITFDLGALEVLDAFKVPVAGIIQDNLPHHLKKYGKKDYVPIGTANDPDFHKIQKMQPDLIIVADASAKHFQKLNAIAPTIDLSLSQNQWLESAEKTMLRLAQLFGKDAEAKIYLEKTQQNFESVQTMTQHLEKAVVLRLEKQQFQHTQNWYEHWGLQAAMNWKEGQKISRKQLLQSDPPFLFILSPHTKSARSFLERNQIQKTQAYQDLQLFYLQQPSSLISLQNVMGQIQESLSLYWMLRERSAKYAKYHDNPEEIQIIWDNADAFWQAVDMAKQADGIYDPTIFQQTYFANRTDFLDSYSRSWAENNDWAYQTYELIPFYESYRPFLTDKTLSNRQQMIQYMKTLQSYYPQAKFPDIYMSIGKMRQGGTALSLGVYLGLEQFQKGVHADYSKHPQAQKLKELFVQLRKLDRQDIDKVLVHEIMHFQQFFSGAFETYIANLRDLLSTSLVEGSAEFLTSIVTGKPSLFPQSSFDYFQAREAELWQEFQADRQTQKFDNWLYNGRKKLDRPADLGYLMGFHIAQAYWEKMQDKQQAFADIVNWTDAEDFLKKSGYAELHQVGIHYPKIPDHLKTLGNSFGNPNSDVVIINTQGGPMPKLHNDFQKDMMRIMSFDAKKLFFINAHQAQTLHPKQFEQEISFQQAIEYGKQTSKILADLIQYFQSQQKKVYVIGVSYGAFAVTDLLAEYGNIADKYLAIVGRLDMNEKVWKSFSQGIEMQFQDGIRVIPVPQDGDTVQKNLRKLAAAFGHKRYTQLLANTDLSNMIYIYGKTDQAVGSLTAKEVEFLQSKDVTVIASKGGHEVSATHLRAGLNLLLADDF